MELKQFRLAVVASPVTECTLNKEYVEVNVIETGRAY